MGYLIIEHAFAPKARENEGYDILHNSHGILYMRCNYRCKFCTQNFDAFHQYREYDEFSFTAMIMRLMQKGKNFKFTGGEATLNPNLKRDLKIVKNLGGTVFLDTNGSNPEKVKELLDADLIDVLAVSFKGLSKEECIQTANITKGELCWENTQKTIYYGSHTPRVKVIITHVCYNDVSLQEIETFADLISPYPNVYLKINNLLRNPKNSGLCRIDSDYLRNTLCEFKKQHPEWSERIIYIDTIEAMPEYEKIQFL